MGIDREKVWILPAWLRAHGPSFNERVMVRVSEASQRWTNGFLEGILQR